MAPEHGLAWIAQDSAEGVRRCAADRPDVILMDLILPLMDGLDFPQLRCADAKASTQPLLRKIASLSKLLTISRLRQHMSCHR